jgi:hypothetical protein
MVFAGSNLNIIFSANCGVQSFGALQRQTVPDAWRHGYLAEERKILGISNSEVASRQNSIPGAEVARSLQEFSPDLVFTAQVSVWRTPF